MPVVHAREKPEGARGTPTSFNYVGQLRGSVQAERCAPIFPVLSLSQQCPFPTNGAPIALPCERRSFLNAALRLGIFDSCDYSRDFWFWGNCRGGRRYRQSVVLPFYRSLCDRSPHRPARGVSNSI